LKDLEGIVPMSILQTQLCTIPLPPFPEFILPLSEIKSANPSRSISGCTAEHSNLDGGGSGLNLQARDVAGNTAANTNNVYEPF
jgi:hypothetical protein